MPSTWNNIIGHDWAVALLAGAIEHDRVGHAYLITGPEHVGKTTLARTFAQALNCENGREPEVPRQGVSNQPPTPCGQCRACKLIAEDRHPDVRLVEPEVSGRGKLTLKIETIRELQRDLNLSAYEARRKVAILTRFDAATIGAANAFLKTLEEPPQNVVLLLTATDADTLLPRLARAAGRLDYGRCPPTSSNNRLPPAGRFPTTSRICWPIWRTAVWLGDRATGNPDILADRAQHLDWLGDALNGDRVIRFGLADKLARKPENLPAILQSWLSWWRDLALLAQGATRDGILLTNIDQEPELTRLARAWTAAQALASLKQTNLALWQLERNANTRLVLENLLLVYPHIT